MIGLLGKKVGMTQMFSEDGRQIPVTVLQVGPCHVTNVRTNERDGYQAVQLGFDEVAERKLTSPKRGQLKKAGTPALRFIREIRTGEVEGVKVGQQVKSDNFEIGDFVDVEGTSIGKGFQGVVKRHGFKGGASRTHGSKVGRKAGSTGQSAYPSRVIKGMKGAGHAGNRKVTVQNLKVLTVDHESDLIVVKGAVPGVEGRYLVVRTALKKGPKRKWKIQGAAEEKKASQEAPPKEKAGESAPPAEAKPEASDKKS